MQAVTITQITPPELESLIENSIKKVLSFHLSFDQIANNPWFDLSELCEYLPGRPKKATVYGYVSAGTIPYHKGAKKLRFLKSEIDAWLMQGKVNTIEETRNRTDMILEKRRRTFYK